VSMPSRCRPPRRWNYFMSLKNAANDGLQEEVGGIRKAKKLPSATNH